MNELKKLFAASLLLLTIGCGRTKETAPSAEEKHDELTFQTAEPSETSESEDAVESEEPQETEEAEEETAEPEESGPAIAEDTQCDDKACVALYLETYDQLPSNYMTKKEAREYGWEGGALHLVVDGMCIGGDEYSNFEGTLPEEKGRQYYECDIDTLNSRKRGAKRIVYSDDGLIYYTDDHYETFELLYCEE